jgi:hypothetical protein
MWLIVLVWSWLTLQNHGRAGHASAQAVFDGRKARRESAAQRNTRAVYLFDAKFLFASLIWGSIGVGYCIYGKRQQSWLPMAGGILMIAASYFVGSALLMSLLGAAIMALVYVLLKQGY